MNQAHQSECI